ncbi:VCBS repeat-containing protein [Spongiimicrobium salis]|uniref:VCBS repeat-containing protein n=1 Tax=Spongiimicrobium salis TaxID=1667022 RepID=UPI00374CA2D7
MKGIAYICCSLLILVCIACSGEQSKTVSEESRAIGKIFSKLDAASTGITFANVLTETDTLNYFTYPYLYMGGGVATGDINNDGLADLFFTGNMVSNRLYLNKGNLQFEDITEKAGIGGDDRWFTGTTMADVNNDGYLDIYCMVAGQSNPKDNLLYINNGDNTFTERAKEYGLNDIGNSVDASFFDYDKDGDLDVFVANYPITPFQYNSLNYRNRMDHVSDVETDNLYRNDNGHFTKVTEEAQVKVYSLSLSVTVSDLNNDGWPDMYVSNDFQSPDCMYINNQDGTFSNVIKESTEHTSFYGMGVDIADFNNDGFADILQMDMDAASNRRSKANMASMNPLMFENIERIGFQYQFMQNSLQVGNGVQKGNVPKFSDISRFAGLSSTDWSWAPLFADLDNDGWKDVFISNGTRREINNKDYFNALKGEKKNKDSLLIKSLRIPSEKIDNYVFRNKGNLTFERANDYWGLSHEGFSNGAVYVDLDNDGDLEIVTNNIDEAPSLFENTSATTNNYLSVRFKGAPKNEFGLGSKLVLTAGDLVQTQELTLSRGFQSSVAPQLHFGLGQIAKIDEIKVSWPDGKEEVIQGVAANQLLTLEYTNARVASAVTGNERMLFDSFSDTLAIYKHKENRYDDFKYEILLPHKTSQFGPGIAVGDINGDQLDDFYVGAASKYPGGLYFQQADGSFEQQKSQILLEDRQYEDMGALLFDPDNDGDNDLYIVSGGNEFKHDSPMLRDRLYINDGKGNFSKNISSLPWIISSGSRVYANDFDKDGDLDLFVGGRLVPTNYPAPANSYILENISTKGTPKFRDVTKKVAPQLTKLGLVTTANWVDYDQDGWTDLIVAGEWMPIRVFKNNQGKFNETSEILGLTDTTGWWFSLISEDFDNDGDIDLMAGNLGLNYKYKAQGDETFDVYFNDFDGNKRNDIVLSYYNDGEKYPVRGRECSSQQIPSIKKKFESYNEFSTATLTDVYDENKLERGLHYQVKSFASLYLENKNGKYIPHQLPNEAQLAPINQILAKDFDADGKLDVVIGGNLYASEVETPRADAGKGLFLKGNGKGGFAPIMATRSGLFTEGDVKDLALIKIKEKEYILSVKNNDFLQFIRYNAPSL